MIRGGSAAEQAAGNGSYSRSFRRIKAAPKAPPKLEKIRKITNITTRPKPMTKAKPGGLFK
jgi:hypothetical protein